MLEKKEKKQSNSRWSYFSSYLCFSCAERAQQHRYKFDMVYSTVIILNWMCNRYRISVSFHCSFVEHTKNCRIVELIKLVYFSRLFSFSLLAFSFSVSSSFNLCKWCGLTITELNRSATTSKIGYYRKRFKLKGFFFLSFYFSVLFLRNELVHSHYFFFVFI